MPAIIAGFLLTAVPNWTGRPPVAGWQLGGLVALWLAGRVAIALSTYLDPAVTAALSISFPIVLAAVIGREILAAKNRRNLKIVAVLLGLAITDALFHYEIGQFGRPKIAHTLAVALTLLLLMIIAGRILPFFTTNWLKQNRAGALPSTFGRFDIVAMLTSGTALLAWVALPQMEATAPWVRPLVGSVMIAAAAINFLRQARWTPHRTFAEPLLAILHIAYVFVGLGFLLIGLGVLRDNYEFATAGLHAWTSGAIGTMMLAIMTRVSRGHTGRALTAPVGTVALYVAILVAAGARIAAGLNPEFTFVLLPIAGVAWVVAFGGFAILYGSMLTSPRADRL
jgi:uncharacterized protein involved in response to NO